MTPCGQVTGTPFIVGSKKLAPATNSGPPAWTGQLSSTIIVIRQQARIAIQWSAHRQRWRFSGQLDDCDQFAIFRPSLRRGWSALACFADIRRGARALLLGSALRSAIVRSTRALERLVLAVLPELLRPRVMSFES